MLLWMVRVCHGGTSEPTACDNQFSERVEMETDQRMDGLTIYLPRKIYNIVNWRSSLYSLRTERKAVRWMDGRPFNACRNCVELVSVRGCL